MYEVENGVFVKYRGTEASFAIPDGVTEIGEAAFLDCTNLASVSIPASVREIGDWAFCGCSSLTSIDIPEGVTRIGEYAFRSCCGLASIVLPKSLEELGDEALDAATAICAEGSFAHRHCEENHIAYLLDYQYEAFHGLVPQGVERLSSPFHADEETPYVFISYSHRDREKVLPIIKDLYEAGWKIWYDEGLTVGDRYDETLETHVKRCAAFLLFVSENSLRSNYIRRNEIPWALAFGKPIVQCSLREGLRYEIERSSACAGSSLDGIGRGMPGAGGDTVGASRGAVEEGLDDAVGAGGDTVGASRGAVEEGLDDAVGAEGSYVSAVLPEGIVPAVVVSPEGIEQALEEIPGLARGERRVAKGISVAIDPAARRAATDGYACCLYSADGEAVAHAVMLETRRAGCNVRDAIKAELDDAALRGCSCLVAFLDSALLANETLAHALIAAYQAGQDVAVCSVGIIEDVELPQGLTGLDKEHWLDFAHGISADMCTRLADHLQRRGCRDAAAIPGFEYERTTEGIVIKRYVGTDPSPRIEPEYGGVPVVEMAESAFEGCACLESFAVPEGVEQIADRAFCGCVNLISIDIPESVTSIGDYAFSDCTSLGSVVIPEGVTVVGTGAFCDCTSLASVAVPASVAEIGEGAFSGCSELADRDGFVIVRGALYSYLGEGGEVVIPDGVTRIEDGAFEACSGLTSVVIPSGVTRIGETAFFNCSNLTSVDIPGSVNEIGDWAFSCCTSLVSIVVPDGVTTIGGNAFETCSNLVSLSVPDSVVHIGARALEDCDKLCVTCSPDSQAWLYCEKLGVPTISSRSIGAEPSHSSPAEPSHSNPTKPPRSSFAAKLFGRK